MTIDFHHFTITQRANIDEIMKVVFKSEKQAKVGSLILKKMLEKGVYSQERTWQFGLYEADMRKVLAESKVSRPTFFKVLKRLRFIGLVNKQYRFYYLGTEFPNALRRLERAIRIILKPKLKRIRMDRKGWEESQYI
ncbi:MAG: hypothetical protein QMD36_02745 [Candidatus Aenigmarchaeota archaeon]|nr:hypothetical protein [Candidatus Aenigmarchaeota archaeon]